MEREKLPRLPIGEIYTTGDDQEWTYEYTDEDWEATKDFPTAPMDSYEGKLIHQIREYFRNNPDKAAKYGINVNRFW